MLVVVSFGEWALLNFVIFFCLLQIKWEFLLIHLMFRFVELPWHAKGLSSSVYLYVIEQMSTHQFTLNQKYTFEFLTFFIWNFITDTSYFLLYFVHNDINGAIHLFSLKKYTREIQSIAKAHLTDTIFICKKIQLN